MWPLSSIALPTLYKNNEAVALCQRALAIQENALGPSHPDVAGTLASLANVYYPQGRYNKGVALYQRALAIERESAWPEPPRGG